MAVVDGSSVLVVEDDTALRELIARSLRENGFPVVTAADGTGALRAAGTGPDSNIAAVVLDIGLPDSDGRDVCQALRARGIDVPVLFLTAKDQVHDVLSGFAAGGDDHLAKPFHVSVLLARVRALIRRGGAPLPSRTRCVTLDPAQHALLGNGVRQPLTPTEFRLLATLMGAGDSVVRRRELVRAGWPEGAIVADNTLDQYVARLRRKLTAVAEGEHAITTVHGVGYRFT